MNTWDQKLKAGIQGEEIAKVYLESLGHTVDLYIPDHQATALGLLRAMDLRVNGTPTEVKLDIMSAKTGNIVIEHQSLKTHTAPWYVWIVPTFYRISQKDLQFLVDTWPDKVKMGDDLRDGTKIPINSETFREHFSPIK